MSFTRQAPGGFAVGAILPSGTGTYWDLAISNALDKSAAGDTLIGVVGMGASAQILANTPGALIGGGITGGIQPKVAWGIASGVTSGIASTVDGGIQLGGTANDWPTFKGTRSRTLVQPPTPILVNTGWTVTFGNLYPGICGPGTIAGIWIPITAIHHGATLSSVQAFVSVKGPHSGVPNVLPSMYVGVRSLQTVQTDASSTTTMGSAAVFPTPGSGAAWDNSALIQSWTYNCTQQNVINTSLYAYFIYLQDESGSGNVAGNEYIGFKLNYTNVSNLAFP